MKKVLFPLLALVLALPMAAVPTAASPTYIETLYLSDTGTKGDGTSELYEVVINTVDNRAELTPLPNGTISFNHVDAIACTPDGLFIYCIDDSASNPSTHHLGVYDVTLETFTDLGLITTDGSTVFTNTDQAAFSTGGTLYVLRNEDDMLYTLDIDPLSSTYLQVSAVGTIKRDGVHPVDIGGADIVFDENDVCYLWTYRPRTDAPQGLYTFPEPTTTGDITATWCSPSASVKFTGMAIRGGGAGDLLGSRTDTNQISVIDKITGQVSTEYPMMTWNGASWETFNQKSGDMTVGELAVKEEEEKCADLIAGQHTDVGDVNVWNDGTYLYVQYVLDDPWVMAESHLHVATSLEGIPQTQPNKKWEGGDNPPPGHFDYSASRHNNKGKGGGNPIPGQFDYSDPHGPVTDYTYTIDLTWTAGTTLYIAAHAVVIKVTGEGYDIDASCHPVEQKESAWGYCEENGGEFPGKNWATYITYEVQ